MKGKTIIFGSIFACFLMLLIPTISSIESGSIKENATDYNKEELIDAIKERIEQLNATNPDPKITLKDDPDGPTEGGLDDRRDWGDLFRGILSGFTLAKWFKNHQFINILATHNIYVIVSYIIQYESVAWRTLTNLGDAFDIIDPDGDGY